MTTKPASWVAPGAVRARNSRKAASAAPLSAVAQIEPTNKACIAVSACFRRI